MGFLQVLEGNHHVLSGLVATTHAGTVLATIPRLERGGETSCLMFHPKSIFSGKPSQPPPSLGQFSLLQTPREVITLERIHELSAHLTLRRTARKLETWGLLAVQVQSLALLLMSCETSAKILNLPVPQFPYV